MTGEHGHILVVDDHRTTRLKLSLGLKQQGHTVAEAENGQQALDIMQTESFDLILLDILMPEMDGYQVLEQMKKDSSLRDIPVIVISAQDEIESVVKGIELGADDYLPKSFEPVLLEARIGACLEKKRLRDLQQLYLKSLEREMEIAREIQQGFLPSELPKVDGWEIAAHFKAAREVAGDFYDSFLLPDGNLVCVIGDVCGKGVGAALFMTLFRSLIRATITTDVFCRGNEANTLTPSERLHHVIPFINTYIADTHGDTSTFASVFIGIFDIQDGMLTYVNCGNEPPIWLGKGSIVTVLKPTGPVVGLFPGVKFLVEEVLMEKNDLLLLYTDGIPDARSSDDEPFGRERLFKLMNAGVTTPALLLENIEEQLYQFIGAAKQFDDITLLAVRRFP